MFQITAKMVSRVKRIIMPQETKVSYCGIKKKKINLCSYYMFQSRAKSLRSGNVNKQVKARCSAESEGAHHNKRPQSPNQHLEERQREETRLKDTRSM